MANRKLKFALLTLLGFAPACSTVKAPRSGATPPAADTAASSGDSLRYMIRVMYGVRPPSDLQEAPSRPDSAAVVTGYAEGPRRIITAYGVRSPKDSVAAKSEQDTIDAFKCIMPPPPKGSGK